MNNFACALIVISILAFQTGCGSSGGGSDDSSNDNDPSNTSTTGTETDNNQNESQSASRTVRLVGTVGVVESNTASNNSPFVAASANFVEYENAFEIPESATAPFSDLLGTCEVSMNNSSEFGDIPQLESEDNSKTENIDAGTGLTISSADENYLNLDRINVIENTVFYTSIEKPSPMASDLKLTIPGNALFPAFTDVPMSTVNPVNLESPVNNAVRFDTTFTWQAGGDPNALVIFSASGFNTSVDCITEDSGSFEFPTDTQNELGTGFFGNQLETTRLAYDIKFKDEAALILFSMSITD